MSSELRDLYQEVILDHHKKPRNFRAMDDATRRADGHNPLCGDRVTIFVRMAGDTIADLLTNLDSQFPGIRDRLITGEGGLHRFVNVYVNDEDVRFLGALDAKLSDGDSVTILPAVAGGALGFAAAAALLKK